MDVLDSDDNRIVKIRAKNQPVKKEKKKLVKRAPKKVKVEKSDAKGIKTKAELADNLSNKRITPRQTPMVEKPLRPIRPAAYLNTRIQYDNSSLSLGDLGEELSRDSSFFEESIEPVTSRVSRFMNTYIPNIEQGVMWVF